VQSLGWNKETEFRIPIIPFDLRGTLEPGLPDRRGLRKKTVAESK
jgi:hypothetical protein